MGKDRSWVGLIVTSLISQSGSYFLTLALSAYVFSKTGSPVKAGLVFVLSSLPSVVASGQVGAWIDHHLSKKNLIVNELISASASLVCGIVLYYGFSVAWICAVIGVRSIFLQVERTSLLKWIKEISPVETQRHRFRLFFLAFFISTLVAGLLVTVVVGKTFSPKIVFIDVVSYLIAIAIIALLPAVHLKAPAVQVAGRVFSTLREIFATPLLRGHLLYLCFTQALFQGTSTVLVVLLPLAHFGSGMASVGQFQVAISLGITAGFLVNAWPLVARMVGRFSVGIVGVGVLCLILSTTLPNWPAVLVTIFLLNLAYEAVWLNSMTTLLSSILPSVLGRYQFVAMALSNILMSLSMLVYSALLERHSVLLATSIHTAISTVVLLGFMMWKLEWPVTLKRLRHYNVGFLRGFWLARKYAMSASSLIVNPRAHLFIASTAKLKLKGRFIFGYTPFEAKNQLFAHAGQLTMREDSLFETEGRTEIWPGMKIFLRKNARIKIGDQTYFAGDGTIVISTSLKVGSQCAISWGVQILDTDAHDIFDSSGHAVNPDQPITIGDRVWIGQGVKILKGVAIGNNVIVGAGSVVTGSFGDNCVIAGNPAKMIRALEGTWGYVPKGRRVEEFCW